MGLTGFILPLAKIGLVIGALLTAVAYAVWIERRLLALAQQRLGPNRVGFGILATLPIVGGFFSFLRGVGLFGLGQPIADGIKLFLKEDITPEKADPWTYRIAPLIALMPIFAGFAVIPFGPDIEILGTTVSLGISDISIGVLYLLALGSLASYGVILAGWSSGSKYPLMGALRASAQMISYELALGLGLLCAVATAGTLSMRGILEAGGSVGMIVVQPLAFLIVLIASIAETNRTPFDLPEAESELVCGFNTEYSGMRFALFFMAEYAHIFLSAAIVTTVFLGGWHIPFIPPEATPWPLGVISFVVKVYLYLLLLIWIRATLPRFRYDRLMAFSWKVLIPLAFADLLVTGIVMGVSS